MYIRYFLVCLLLACATPSYAYIGPGLGAGALAAVGGVIFSVFAAIFAVTYYPIKRAFKRRKAARKGANQELSADKDKADTVKSDQG